MKRFLLLMVACLLVFSAPVLAADVDAYVDVKNDLSFKVDFDKDKDMDVYKNVYDDFKTTSDVKLYPDSRAMSEVTKKQINEDNNFALFNVKYDDVIKFSFYGFTGIGQANQAAGSMNNQANIVSLAFVGKMDAWINSEVIDFQLNHQMKFEPRDPYGNYFSDSIDYSFNNFIGIGQVNQSAGMANNQNNIVSIAAAKASLIAESDVFLDQVNVNNFVLDSGVTRTNTISGSFNGFKGIGQANQSAGNFNNQSNVVSVAASFSK